MSYATANDLALRLGATVYGEIYPEETEAASDLADAEAEINGCIGRRYLVPVTAPEALPLLKGWTLTLAEERAYARAAGSSFTEKLNTRAAQVRKYLDEIRSGQFQLPGAAENEQAVISISQSDEEVFGRDNMEGF